MRVSPPTFRSAHEQEATKALICKPTKERKPSVIHHRVIKKIALTGEAPSKAIYMLPAHQCPKEQQTFAQTSLTGAELFIAD
jgi:hypothetical protein